MANTQTDSTSLAALTLSKIAYTDETEDGNPQQKADIITALGNVDSAAQGPWQLVWGPNAYEGNMAYVALNAAQDRYAVAIRGTVSSDSWAMLENILQDVEALIRVDWLFPQNSSEVYVSSGFQDGLENIVFVPDPISNCTLMDFLRPALANSNAELLVTGHSLGGALATMVALWLQNQLPNSNGPTNTTITPITFAAPTAGNQDFATLYDSTFPNSLRYANQYDLVPMGYGNVETLITQYIPVPSLKAYNEEVYYILEGVGWGTDLAYAQTNQKNGTISFAGPAPSSSNTFPEEVGIQHATSTYMSYFTGGSASSTAAGK